MRNTSLTESFLALFAGRGRAAAIMGDLDEMAATRGRGWLMVAYVRTLASVGWRTAVACFVAIVSGAFLYSPTLTLLFNHDHRVDSWMHIGLYSGAYPHAWIFNWNLALSMSQGLFFLVPFVLIRFGLRNRLTQLACALFLITLPIFSLNFLLLDVATIGCAMVVAVALLLPLWRRPMIVLAATCLPATAFHLLYLLRISNVAHVPQYLLDWSWKFPVIFALYRVASLVIASAVCLYLSHRLLQDRAVTDRNIA